ncbi:MAG: FAD-dependent thymidylate synthase [Candidatus Hydrothermales bacterium]
MEFKVLDKGFLRLVDFMGGDKAVIQAARVSYGSGLKGEEKDKKLLFFLLENEHMTPFEHSVFKFHVKCPIFVARQWFRHRWGSFNEISGRYTEYKEEFYLPEKLRIQSKKNKQVGEFGFIENESELIEKIREIQEKAYEVYKILIENNVARELARIVCPLSLYTEFYWTVNARSLMNFLRLRLDLSAQYEIREYAKVILKIFKEKMPWTYEAFLTFCLKNKDGYKDIEF